jgi:hypothetical protein
VAERLTVMSREFNEGWPDALMAMHKWIREQIAMTGGAAGYEVRIAFSLPSLLAARRDGVSLQPALDEFRLSVMHECGIEIPRPDGRHGLRKDGPHQVRFFYWR